MKPLLWLLLLLFFFFSSSSAQQISPSQTKTLFRIQRILEYPTAFNGWNNYTNFCYLPPSPSLTISCSGNRITELSATGGGPALSSSFSIDSLFTTLSRLPSLTVLSLVSLGLWGSLPPKINRFPSLRVLNLSSNYISGEIPESISSLASLRSLVLDGNRLNGTVPDLASVPDLEEVDLGGNRLGPDFPVVGKSIASLVLSNNSFRAKIPLGMRYSDKLQRLIVSSNQLAGPIPSFLFSLPSIRYLDLAGNRLVGVLPVNLSCGAGLEFVDLSRNLLVGRLPACIRSNSSTMVVLDSWNCLSSAADLRHQHPNSYCNEGALAAVLPVAKRRNESKNELGLVLAIVGGIVGGVVVLGLVLIVVLKKARAKDAQVGGCLPKSVAGKASVKTFPRLHADARHMSQAVRLGTLGLTPYREFNMEELEDATNNFDPSNLMQDSSQGQMYKCWLRDGSAVVRCLKLKQKHSPQSLAQFVDVISKLRHRHLVSILGHCIDSDQDNPNSTNTIYLIFEYVSNGTLRSHLTEWRKCEMLKWPQRVAAVIGVARGIQFLHTVTVPGISGNDLKIENILLDETLTPKFKNYNLPMPPKNKNNKGGSGSPFSAVEESDLVSVHSVEHGEKEDVYQLGLILLEIITGKPVATQNELDALKHQLQKSLTDGQAKLCGLTDPTIRGTFAYDSLRTAVEITLNCVSNDHSKRPSLDDVLWNLQYSVQVQDGWASSESLTTHS